MISTGERLMKVETQITELKSDLKQHCGDQREDFDKVFKKLDSMSKSFAGKWVEKVIVGIIIILIGSVAVIAATGGV